MEITVKVPDTGEYGERTLSLTLEQDRTPEVEETEISMPSGFGIHW